MRGGSGFAAFASAKFGLRAVAQAMARELGPKNIHVAHLIIDSGVDTAWVRERREQLWGKEALNNPDLLMPPASVAASYWQLTSSRAAPGPSSLKSGRSGKSGRDANSEWRIANGRSYSPFATRHSPLKNNNKRS